MTRHIPVESRRSASNLGYEAAKLQERNMDRLRARLKEIYEGDTPPRIGSGMD